MRLVQDRIEDYIDSIDDKTSLRSENRLISALLIPVFVVWAVFIAVTFSILGIDREVIILDVCMVAFNAIFLFAIQRIKISETLRSNLVMLSFSIFYVFIIFHFRRVVGDSIWIISGTFLFISLLKSNCKLLIILSIETIAMAISIKIIYPDELSSVVFISQLALLFGIFLFATLVKIISIRLFTKVVQQSKRSEAIAKISTDLLDASVDNLDDKLEKSLRIFRSVFNIEKIGVFLLSQDRSFLHIHVESCASDIRTSDNDRARFYTSNDFWWEKQINDCSMFIINNVQELDEFLSVGISIMKKQGVHSFLSVPILKDENVYGFVFIQSYNPKHIFTEKNEQSVKIFANILGDAYEKVKAEKEVMRLAYCDVLTGLPNRYQFNISLEQSIDTAKNNNTNLAVLFLDLDSFKSINDTMGHEGGDMLLKEVATSLRSKMKYGDIVARFGGDEFIVLFSDFQDEDELLANSNNIMNVFEKPVIIKDQEFYVAASAGLAVYPTDGVDVDSLIKNADLAMYQAKDNGKNQISRCTSSMKEEVEAIVNMTNKLYKAQKNNEFVLYYQPQIEIVTNQIVGVEALIRWNQPELGMISPSKFIPLAEQSGLINSIGHWVLETACRQSKEWQDKGLPPIRMAVNLSLEQFRNPNLSHVISSVLRDTKVDPTLIELEITESIAIDNSTDIVATLRDLKALGVTISIDDFGTEYSSLARITQLPIDRIKMAMEFVSGISLSEKDEAVVKIIIALASNLNLKIIAEGVETENQLKFLEERIVNEVQGFYFYKPMPASEIEKILKDSVKVLNMHK